MSFTYHRVVDLTLPIVPGEGGRPFVIERGRTEELTPHVPVDHPWYVMHRIQTISHIGTYENVANLDQLRQPRVFVCALPVPVKGLDAFPLRVVAFE